MRGRSGPWYWRARGGWYATVAGKRHRLLDGPDDDFHAGQAKKKYETIKSPRSVPDEQITTAFAAGRKKGLGDGIAVGRLTEAFRHIRWSKLLEDHYAGDVLPGVEKYVAVEVLGAVGLAGLGGFQACETSAEAEARLEKIGVMPHPKYRNVLLSLRELSRYYPAFELP